MAEDDIDPINEILSDNTDLSSRIKEANKATVDGYEALRQAYVRWKAGKAIGNDLALVDEDMRRFCRADTTTFDPDARVHALLSGRQEVYYRIQDFTRLSLDEILARYTKPYEANPK